VRWIDVKNGYECGRRREGVRKGILITFEGVEGSGKTTHSRLLAEYLRSRSCDCVLTREPGGTRLGEIVRKVLLHSKGVDISDMTELFLFEACRSQVVSEIIKPALDKNGIVVCDRYTDATFSYQGYGSGLGLDAIRTLNEIASMSIKPDLTILLDIESVEGLGRASEKGCDRMEMKAISYHRKVRRGYLKLAKEDPARIKIVPVTGGIKATQDCVRREAELVIQKHKRTK
jgi:dTMP kinase